MLNGHRIPFRDVSNELRLEQLEIEKLKLSEGMEYLRERMREFERENKKLSEEIIALKKTKDD